MTGKGEAAEPTSSVSFASLLALVVASLPMYVDPAIHNVAVVLAGDALGMNGAQRALAASMATLCIAASILATGSLGDRLGHKKIMMAGLAVAMVLLAAFAAWEWRAATPAFPIRSFTDRELMVGALAGVGFDMAGSSISLQLSQLWQYVYRFTPFEVSLGLLPFVLACIVAAGWAGQLVARGVSIRLLVPAASSGTTNQP